MLDRIQYGLEEIRKNGRKGKWWKKRFISRFLGPAQQKMTHDFGANYVEEDWDNLIILDACRADMFEETFNVKEEFDSYRTVESVGSSSQEWLDKTFSDRKMPDTVYISGNPWVSKIVPNNFYKMVNLWSKYSEVKESELENFKKLEDTSEDRNSTIYPESVNSEAKDAFNKSSDKRYIIHYFQPHSPIIVDENGELIRPPENLHPETISESEEVSREYVWNRYKHNLKYVYAKADELAQFLGGKTVFTSDHGELFGEETSLPFGVYGHPANLRTEKLNKVPWAVKNYGDRRSIRSEETNEVEVDEEAINSHLEDLGYK